MNGPITFKEESVFSADSVSQEVEARAAEEAAEREAKERAEREVRERIEKELREKAEREAKEKAEREAKERAEREAKARTAAEPVVTSESTRKLAEGLASTRSNGFIAQIGRIFKGTLNASVRDDLEEILFTADIGVKTSERLLDRVTENLKNKADGEAAMALLKSEVQDILKACEKPFEIGNEKPHVILVVGVNGAGKTTTLGKLAAKLVSEGKKVLLIAGDTFRAAAIEQLEEWQKRCGCEIYSRKQGADPSGTIFDGIKYAEEHGFDVALADTAGRLHNKKDLIEELKKIDRVAGKAMEGAPHQVILVLDATNGQNALIQAREFGEAIPFTGIILTKLDGTAKGGVIIGICEEFKKPIYYIGIGEMIDDLRRFNANEFLEALFLEA